MIIKVHSIIFIKNRLPYLYLVSKDYFCYKKQVERLLNNGMSIHGIYINNYHRLNIRDINNGAEEITNDDDESDEIKQIKMRQKYQIYINECWNVKQEFRLSSYETLTMMATIDKYFTRMYESECVHHNLI
jgi:hypothetical protein